MSHSDVLIIGGGPVGLHLACRVAAEGFSVRVLEQRRRPSQHSRSIGIHPPALESLAEINVADDLIAAGVRVFEGCAVADGRVLGRVRFDSCPPPYRFVLAIPQFATEALLDRRLRELSPDSYHRGVPVREIMATAGGTKAITEDGKEYSGTFMVGCDGARSMTRETLGISFDGETYPDWFVMGDFRDDSGLGPVAMIYLTSQGLVESFPLPGGIRRWVVRVALREESTTPEHVRDLVADRVGIPVDAATCQMTSAFGVQRLMASSMAAGPFLLAGDAGHVVSPIGGQGMNLGWLDSRDAASALTRALLNPAERDQAFAAYSRRRLQAARRAANRAEFNMGFGRPSGWAPLRRLAVRAMLAPGARAVFARRFTMRGL